MVKGVCIIIRQWRVIKLVKGVCIIIRQWRVIKLVKMYAELYVVVVVVVVACDVFSRTYPCILHIHG